MKNKISIIVGFVVPIMLSILLFAYENREMHPDLNRRMVDQFSGNYSNVYGFSSSLTFKLSDDQFFGKKIINTGLLSVDEADFNLSAKEWIAHGGFSSDEPELDASLRHFYDPFAVSGQTYLTDKVDGIVSSMAITNPKMNAKTWALTAQDNDYNFTVAKEKFKRALEENDQIKRSEYFGYAYRALGETLHLLADMGCPPHVRNDAHPAYLTSGDNLYGDADPYEELVNTYTYLAFANPKEIPELTELFRSAVTVSDLFDIMAVFTNNYFFSDDTQNGDGIAPNNGLAYPYPYIGGDVILNPADNYYYSYIGSHNVKMTEAKSYFFSGKYPKITYECVKEQAEILLPAVVEAGANAMKLFFPKLSVTILDADNEGYIEGRITHSLTEEWQEEIKYTGPIEIYQGDNLLHTVSAVNGMFLEQNISLTAAANIKAKINSGGMVITSPEITVKERSTDPGCVEEIKSKKYILSGIGIYIDEGSGRFFWGPSGRSYGFTQRDDAVWDELTWSGNTFSVEQTIITEYPSEYFWQEPTNDTLYYRIEGQLSQDGSEIGNLYCYNRASAVAKLGTSFIYKQERVMSFRLTNLSRRDGTTDCTIFNRYQTADIQNIVSDVQIIDREIEYYWDNTTSQWLATTRTNRDWTLNPADIVEYQSIDVKFKD